MTGITITGPGITITGGINLGGTRTQIVGGCAIYYTPGTYTWTAPPCVTSVSVVAVGGGAGGYAGACAPGSGGPSYFQNPSMCAPYVGGGGGTTDKTPANYLGCGGGVGGVPCGAGCSMGGGGAGGYTGPGGQGTAYCLQTSTAGSGGGGGGGGGVLSNTGGGGGGVGILGQGANGAAGLGVCFACSRVGTGGGGGSPDGGGGGSNGQDVCGLNGGYGGIFGGGGGSFDYFCGGGGGALGWANNIPVNPGCTYTVQVGAGGSGGVSACSHTGGNGGTGGVRIVWPGDIKQFPSNNVGYISFTLVPNDFTTAGHNTQLTVTGNTSFTVTGGAAGFGPTHAFYSAILNANGGGNVAFTESLINYYNTYGWSLTDFQARVFNVNWAAGSTALNGLAYVTFYYNDVNDCQLLIGVIDPTNTAYQTQGVDPLGGSPGPTVLLGTFNFPATFSLYTPETSSASGNQWC